MSWLRRRVEVNSSSVIPGKLETSLRRKLLNYVCGVYTFKRTIRAQGDRSGGYLESKYELKS
jgi:hypothetical protein